MRKIFALLLLVPLSAGCPKRLPPGNHAPVAFRADRAEYRRGDTVRLELVNASSEEVGYNLCFSQLQRRSGAGWTPAEASDQVCPAVLLSLPPGGRATGMLALPAGLPAGVYRASTRVEPRGGGPETLLTDEFTVR